MRFNRDARVITIRSMRPIRHDLFVALLAALFVFAGTMHFVIPVAYASIMPPWVPSPMVMVYLSGVFEIAGGLGVLIPALRRTAGVGLIVLLIAVFPANVQMLQQAIGRGASPLLQTLLWLRLPLQPLLIYSVYRATMRLPFGPSR